MKLPPNERFRGGEIYRIDVAWVGANPAPRIEKGEASPDYENYYNVAYGVEPALFVRRYRDVWYRGVWDGIDIHFHVGGEGEMEYTWVVAPGGDVGRIRVQVGGAEVRVEGSYLVYWTPFGEVREGPLRAWQGDGKPVQVCWRVEGDMVTLSAEGYDRTQTLYIDPPTRVWGTYYGGSSWYEVGWGLGLAVDKGLNIYLASDTNSSDQIASTGAHQTTYGGGTQDLFLAKFDSNGMRLWATYYGGADWDYGGAVAVDTIDNTVYLGGGTGTSGAPVGVIATPGAHQTTLGGSWDACLVKFTSAGIRLWGTYYGGSLTEAWSTSAVAVSPIDGSVYLTAGTNSLNNISTFPTSTNAGSYDAFIARFRPNGQRIWGRYFGGSELEGFYAVAVATDAAGDAYIASYTTSTNLPVVNAHQSTYGGGACDAFMARFDTSGNVIWATYYGGSGDDGFNKYFANSIRLAGNLLLVAGLTDSPNNIASPGAYQTTLAGSFDAFLVCFELDGTRRWATYYGGENVDYGYSVGGDGGTGFYLAGHTRSNTGIATPPPNTYNSTNSGGGFDAFVAKFNCEGSLEWGTYYGGENWDEGWAVVADGVGSVYLAGRTYSSTGIASPNAYSPSLGGLTDAYLVRFHDPIHPRVRLVIEDSVATICEGGANAFFQINGQYGAPPYQFSMIPGAPTWQNTGYFGNLTAGTYTLRVRDACGFIDSLQVEVREAPLYLTLVDSLTRWCGSTSSGYIEAIASGGFPPYTYQLLPIAPSGQSSGSFSNLPAGTYTLVVRDARDCEKSRLIYLDTIPSIQITLTAIDSIRCAGERGGLSVQATGGGGLPYTYTLLPIGTVSATGTFTGLPAGTYTVRVESECVDSIQVLLSEPDSVKVSAVGVQSASCPTSRDGSLIVNVQGGSPPYTYLWSDHNGVLLPVNEPALTGLAPGVYTLIVQDRNSCTSEPLGLTVGYTYAIQLKEVRYEWAGECPQLYLRLAVDAEGVAPLTYHIHWGDGLTQTFTTGTGIERDLTGYTSRYISLRVEARSGGMCMQDTTFTVEVPLCEQLIIPNAFTPNGDGVNDLWFVRAVGFVRYNIVVYDRWGVEVWRNEGDASRFWDGRNKAGQPVPEDAYAYIFWGVRRTGEEVQRTGTVMVLR